MFRRAAREVRVVGGLLLIVGVAIAAVVGLNRVTVQADRDFALCGGAHPGPDCVSKRRPVSVVKTDPSDELAQGSYEVIVQTSPNVSASLFGLTRADAAPFQGLRTTELRYRQGRLVAVVAPDGTSYEFPFAFTKELLIVMGSAIAAGLLGMGSVAWGLTRVNRTPQV